MKLLSRLFTALNLLPSMATLAFASRPILRHKAIKRAQTFLMAGPLSLPEVGDGFVIRNEPPSQPHHFQIAASLTLQPPARWDPVEIAVNVKLEHRRRMIRRPAGRCRIDAVKPEVAQFQRIHEHIDRANRIALVDPIIEAFRQQRRLLAIRPLNETLHHFPGQFSKEIIASTGFSHSLGHQRTDIQVSWRSALALKADLTSTDCHFVPPSHYLTTLPIPPAATKAAGAKTPGRVRAVFRP